MWFWVYKATKHYESQKGQRQLRNPISLQPVWLSSSCHEILESSYRIKKHEPEQHPCNLQGCDYVGNTISALKSHTEKIHENGQTLSLLCDQCSFMAKTAADMRKHVEDHNPFAFEYSQCDFKTI